MSRTALRYSQPPGGKSSISLGWTGDQRHPFDQRPQSARREQPTPRRTHESSRASSNDCSRDNGRNPPRGYGTGNHTPSQTTPRPQRRHEDPPTTSSRHSRQALDRPMSTRRESRKMETTMQPTSRSSAQVGPSQSHRPSERRHSERYAASDKYASRTLPGEELHAPGTLPFYGSWMDHGPSNDRPPSRSDPRQQPNHRARGYDAGASAPCYTGLRTKEVRRSKPSAGSSSLGLVKPRQNVAFRSSGSSRTTSARGDSVIDSRISDLWETGSIDSMPLGAEWFSF